MVSSTADAASGPPPLARLDAARRRRLKVLYLAPHAPDPDAPPPLATDARFGVQPAYHHEIFVLLRDGLGLDVEPCADLDLFQRRVTDFNYVFTLYNIAPFRNSEIFVSAVCAYHGIACLGAPPNVRALAEDKWHTKWLAAGLGIPVPRGAVYGRPDALEQSPGFPGPYIAKPRFGAASAGITGDSAQADFAALRPFARSLIEQGEECLVEEVAGSFDVTVPILAGRTLMPLPVARHVTDSPFGLFTHRQKRKLDPGLRREIVTAGGPEAPWFDGVRRDALTLATCLEPFDYIRCDFRVSADGARWWLLECNLGCSIGSQMAFAQCAAHADISAPALLEHILATSLDRQWTGEAAAR